MPAAAVIPAPIAYIKVVAVKKLVVGLVNVLGANLRHPGRSFLGGSCRALGCLVADVHLLL